jgi:hypothetical protein
VASAVLYPNGTIDMKGDASPESRRLDEILRELRTLRQEVADLRR